MLFGYAWLLIASLTGGALGSLASLLIPRENDPQAVPVMSMVMLQGAKLFAVARLQYALTGASWMNSQLQITGWFVVPLVVLEGAIGLLAFTGCTALLALARRRDLRFLTEK